MLVPPPTNDELVAKMVVHKLAVELKSWHSRMAHVCFWLKTSSAIITFLSTFVSLSSESSINNATAVHVQTTKGLVEGYILEDAAVFEGIPYAMPPLGNLRFQKPQDLVAWYPFTLEAKDFMPMCPQIITPFSKALNIAGNMSEDCLYLNVYSPLKALGQSGRGLAVMMWIHGGSFVQGSASQTPAPGIVKNFVSRNVLVVTFNYRLDIFGFFSTGNTKWPDNIGLLDQIKALTWVQNEIRSFGGDPLNVTIFGYSAGASSVSAHLYSPLSKNLFSKAIIQSGSSLAPWAWSELHKHSNRDISRKTAKELGCDNHGEWDKKEFEKIFDCLRQYPSGYLLETATNIAIENGLSWKLVVGCSEDCFLPDDPELLAKNYKENIPVLMGTARDETMLTAALDIVLSGNGYSNVTKAFFTKALDAEMNVYFSPEERPVVRPILQHHYGDGLEPVFFNDSQQWLIRTVQMQSAHLFFAPVIKEAHYLVQSQDAPVYLYSLDFVSNGFPWRSSFKGVPHGLDMFYLFAIPPHGLGWSFSEEEYTIIDLMGKMWTNFAKSGNPNVPVPIEFGVVFEPLTETSKWRYLSIDLPPKMNEKMYHWSDAHLFNDLIPQQLESMRHPSSMMALQPALTLQKTPYFITTWILVAFVGLLLLVLVLFSLCHRNERKVPQYMRWKY